MASPGEALKIKMGRPWGGPSVNGLPWGGKANIIISRKYSYLLVLLNPLTRSEESLETFILIIQFISFNKNVKNSIHMKPLDFNPRSNSYFLQLSVRESQMYHLLKFHLILESCTLSTARGVY